jgi:Ca2+/Na+ antiporter
MKKKYTVLPYPLIVSLLYCLFLLPSCQTSRLSTADSGYAGNSEKSLAKAQMMARYQETMPQEPANMQASAENSKDSPAAASTQADMSAIDVTTAAHPATMAHTPIARNTTTTIPQKASTAKKVQQKLSLPARMMLKSVVKKAEKLQKKDITSTSQQKEVNNSRYLILGILLLAAGLVLVLVGSSTLLYILGSVASLAGLIFLLLALL